MTQDGTNAPESQGSSDDESPKTPRSHQPDEGEVPDQWLSASQIDTSEVFKLDTRSDLPDAAVRLLRRVRFLEDDGAHDVCWQSKSAFCQELGWDDRKFYRWRSRLKAAGFLWVESRSESRKTALMRLPPVLPEPGGACLGNRGKGMPRESRGEDRDIPRESRDGHTSGIEVQEGMSGNTPKKGTEGKGSETGSSADLPSGSSPGGGTASELNSSADASSVMVEEDDSGSSTGDEDQARDIPGEEEDSSPGEGDRAAASAARNGDHLPRPRRRESFGEWVERAGYPPPRDDEKPKEWAERMGWKEGTDDHAAVIMVGHLRVMRPEDWHRPSLNGNGAEPEADEAPSRRSILEKAG